jgi:hypothetical protein
MKNPPAFPRSMISSNGPFDSSTYSNGYGMDLRDYFAAKAMQALIDNDGLFSEIPTQAYELADAMLKVREA